MCTSQSLLTYSNTISNWLLLSTTTANWVGLLNHPLPGPLSLACISHAFPPPSPYPYASIYIQQAMHRHTTFFQTNDQILLESLGKQEGSEVSTFWIQKVEWFKWYCFDKIWTHGHTHTGGFHFTPVNFVMGIQKLTIISKVCQRNFKLISIWNK